MSVGELKTLIPIVKWGQRKDLVILRVEVATPDGQADNRPDFTIREEYMDFRGVGVGSSGKAIYQFNLIFYEPVDIDRCRVKFTATEIEFRMLKKSAGMWPRLQATLERPHWIRLDFNLYEGQEESEEEGDGGEEETKGVDPEKMAQMAKTRKKLDEMEEMMTNEVAKYNTFLNYAGNLKNGYLVLYNLVQWVGFCLVVGPVLMGLRDGLGPAINSAYKNGAPALMFCQVLALLEVVHSATGLVKSGIRGPLLQVVGRFLILFVVLRPSVEIHQHPVVFVLFLVWSLVELVRYPFYALSVLGVELSWLTWLRYTVWIPLYPVGFTCEAAVVWLSIPHFEAAGDFQLALPNSLNVSFYPPYIMRAAMLVVPMIAYNLISYMALQRKKQLRKMKSA